MEWCLAVVIWFIGGDVVLSEYHFHHSLVPILSSTCEGSVTCAIHLVDLTTSYIYQASHKPATPK